jgi:signal transduction histidine kinase
MVGTLANQAALALRKIELWEDLQEQVRRLEQALIELKQTQAELIQTEKLASIGQLAGGIAHEINNPLQVILGRVELLLETVSPDSKDAKHLRTVLEHVERIATIVSSLLRFSRRERGENREAVVVDEIVTDAIRLLGNQMNVDNIKLTVDLNCPDATVVASRVQLEQVFMNLILNAYQAMQGTGGELRIGSSTQSGEIVLTVGDTGPGIPEEHLPHIFEPFFTTKPEGQGTGLGLSVIYGIVESHDGRISVQTEVGRGTTFTVTLPLAQSAAKAA